MRIYKLNDEVEGKYGFVCPGCKRTHHIPTLGPSAWSFNGDMERPTFNPSLLSYYPGNQKVCHSFIRDGQIQFLGDCYHELKGQTVDLPEIEY